MRRAADDDDLRRVYRTYVRRVYGFFAYSVSESVAEDLTSQTFERVVKGWKTFDATKASEVTWILTIARNILTDHYRRESHRQTISTDEHPALLDTLEHSTHPLAARVDLEAFAEWLRVLNTRDRSVLAMRYAADSSPAEIAETMGLSVANIHQIISRSLRRLRELAEDGSPPALT